MALKGMWRCGCPRPACCFSCPTLPAARYRLLFRSINQGSTPPSCSIRVDTIFGDWYWFLLIFTRSRSCPPGFFFCLLDHPSGQNKENPKANRGDAQVVFTCRDIKFDARYRCHGAPRDQRCRSWSGHSGSTGGGGGRLSSGGYGGSGPTEMAKGMAGALSAQSRRSKRRRPQHSCRKHILGVSVNGRWLQGRGPFACDRSRYGPSLSFALV